jgi:hypothetical protein
LRRICDETPDGGGDSVPGVVLDLAEVSFIGAEGLPLFRDLLRHRVRLTNCSAFVKEQLKRLAHCDGRQLGGNEQPRLRQSLL